MFGKALNTFYPTQINTLNDSNPPKYGAQLVKTILSDEKLTTDFIDQCSAMADRINTMRVKLRTALEDGDQSRDWSHITKQIGMFAYSGLCEDEVIALRDKHHIYCTLDGRISMAVSSLLFTFYSCLSYSIQIRLISIPTYYQILHRE